LNCLAADVTYVVAYISVCKRRQPEQKMEDSVTVLEEKHLKKRRLSKQ